MRSSILFAFLSYAMLGFMQIASATPVAPTKDTVLKRGNADLKSALAQLEGSITPSVHKINDLIAAKAATQANVEPCINEIKAALKTGTDKLIALKSSSAGELQADATTREIAARIVMALIQLGSNILFNVPILGLLLGPLIILLVLFIAPLLLIIPDLSLDPAMMSQLAQIAQKVSPGVSLESLGL